MRSQVGAFSGIKTMGAIAQRRNIKTPTEHCYGTF